MSLPHGLMPILVAAPLAAGGPWAVAQSAASVDTGPVLGAFGVQMKHGPEFLGARGSVVRLQPNFVLRWGPVTVSNGGPLASRVGEPVEAGLAADLFSLDRLRVSASVSVDQGRNSDAVAELRGLHDIPAHLRGRLRAGWQLHRHWEISTTWRSDLSGRATGNALDLTLLHEWRPEFLDHTRWRISLGASAEWLDAARANLIHGVSALDASRSAYPAYRLDGGWSEWRLFANGRRELGSGWLGYGSITASALMAQPAQGPLARRREAVTATLGVGRRF